MIKEIVAVIFQMTAFEVPAGLKFSSANHWITRLRSMRTEMFWFTYKNVLLKTAHVYIIKDTTF